MDEKIEISKNFKEVVKNTPKLFNLGGLEEVSVKKWKNNLK